ncbi:hypothetical protein [Photorhabdus namnaonensis]
MMVLGYHVSPESGLDKVGSDIELLPMSEEKDFRDYILIIPIFN